ncbi:hypothetical protein FCM35_KLT17035 [Carex littledalei]|uniref:Uncharacterized protein n=1 Tax=Carex littledalei TaxID=544730 RepID=A0A833RMK9_9POAL|nr:hypothetical protein FCM35_KLT17035 [Carex littledalei]
MCPPARFPASFPFCTDRTPPLCPADLELLVPWLMVEKDTTHRVTGPSLCFLALARVSATSTVTCDLHLSRSGREIEGEVDALLEKL